MSYNVGDKVEVCYSDVQWVQGHITNIRNGFIYIKSVDGDSYVCSLSAAAKDIRVPLSSDEAFIKECEDSASPRLTRAIRVLKEATARNRADAAAYAILKKNYDELVDSCAKAHSCAQNKIEYLDHSVLTLSEKFTQAIHFNATISKENEKLRAKIARMRAITFEE